MSPISLLHYVILWFCCQNNCQGKIVTQRFGTKYLLKKTTITDLSIYSQPGCRFRLECSAKCSQVKECVSFFYNTRSGQCTGHAVQFYSTEPGSPDEGSVYYTRLIDKRDCAEILELYPDSPDGVYIINPLDGKGHFRVYCDMTTDGGGWTVFQRRKDGSENFYRNWSNYKIGFGALRGEFWLGNDKIHRLTTSGNAMLRINLGDHVGKSRSATYTNFQVENEANGYRLTVSGFNGRAGNALSYHNGMRFTTLDRDNDPKGGNCARQSIGAWWYNHCHNSNLNGKYGDGKSGKGINWKQWHGWKYSLKWTEMKMKLI